MAKDKVVKFNVIVNRNNHWKEVGTVILNTEDNTGTLYLHLLSDKFLLRVDKRGHVPFAEPEEEDTYSDVPF